ncbi:M48 family metallopeptidase [Pectobacterium wasabiae]|uniref:Peptidase M48 n=1 Tax=Pectobacterium wasabiae TaxID=55208 RepID=A0AAW3EBJ9_9GAMM|nr:M48 family metallopeptidase [Pectobacterium wasabiae]AOR63614.1 peptidase M48 [Pectobacterium wasabiae CFBP 3304]EJS93499.1 Zn-dependent protease with chaperone function [Pectobacterium wasabiae CFBP 3304]KFX02704.1 peptidase M48 [Pectobacterium wasabiae]KGA26593.1 peptidase M48 [Pectobacterium wasabiae]
MNIEGHYQYPGLAARVAASLHLTDNGSMMVLSTESSNTTFTLEQVEVSDALGSIPLTLTFPDGGRFVPSDDPTFRAWYSARRRPGLVHRLERHKRGVILTLFATLFIVINYVYVVLPWASSALALHIPTAIEQQLGQHTLTLLRHSDFKPSKLPIARQQAMQTLFQQVMPADMREDKTPLRLEIMSAPIGPNAFMLADGTLIISDDLVTLAKSDNELAAVMLHEMGHHAYRHPMRMVVRSSLVSLTFMWMTGDVSGVGDIVLQSAAFINEMQFSRDMEREADAWAIAKMQQQGRSLQSMQAMYQALINHDRSEDDVESLDLPDWLSTHPDMDERLRTIEREMNKH